MQLTAFLNRGRIFCVRIRILQIIHFVLNRLRSVMALSYTTHIILFVVSTLTFQASSANMRAINCLKYFENLIFGYSTGNNAFLTHTYVLSFQRFILPQRS